MREYPKGTKFGNYILCQDTPSTYSIRRLIVLPDGSKSQPRYPKAEYKHLSSREELEQFVNRLNHRQDQKKLLALQIRTSFIPQSLKDEFRDLLKIEIPNQKDFRYQYNKVFQRYFLHYFIHKIGVLDPNQWVQHQSQWGAALLHQAENVEHNIFERKMSASTIAKTIQIANRFMALLHLKNPAEYTLTVFDPISRGAMNAYNAERTRTKGEASGIGRFINEQDWFTIESKLPADIAPFIKLAYNYGLRRAESLGFENLESIKKGYLKVSQQLVAISSDKTCRYGALKDRENRQTPHWFCTPNEAYQLISDGFDKKMHPDTLYERWADFIAGLDMDYDLHDLRRTFITRALRLKNPRDVQMAVGHASLATTMRYAMDDRDLADETFNPNAS